MGCSASKSVATKASGTDEGYGQLGRSMSMPVRGRDSTRDSHHVVALTSSTYGILKVDPPPHKQMKKGQIPTSKASTAADEIYEKLKNFDVPAEMVAKPWSEVSLSLPKLPPVAAINPNKYRASAKGEPETINMWELMDGLEEEALGGSAAFEKLESSDNLTGLPKVKKPFENSPTFHTIRTVQDLDSPEAAAKPTPSLLPDESSTVLQMTALKPAVVKLDQEVRPMAQGSTQLKQSSFGNALQKVPIVYVREEDNKPLNLSQQSVSSMLQTGEVAAPVQDLGKVLLPQSSPKQSPSPSTENGKTLMTRQEGTQEHASQFLSSASRGILSEAAASSQDRGKVFPYPPSPKAVLIKGPSTKCSPGSSIPLMAQGSCASKSSAMKPENAPMFPTSLSVRPGLISQSSIVQQTSSSRVENSKAPVMHQDSSRVVSYSPRQATMPEPSGVSGNVSPVPSSMHVLAMAAAFEEEAKKLSPSHFKASPVVTSPQQASNTTESVKGQNKPSQCFSPNIPVSNTVVNDCGSGVSEMGLELESGYVHVSGGKSLSRGILETEELESTIDPDLLASFERELELCSNNEEWHNVRRCDGTKTLSKIPGSRDDENSSKDHPFALPAGADTNGKGNKIMEAGYTDGERGPKAITLKTSKCSTTTPVVEEAKSLKPDPLESFEAKCPPGGGEQRVVLYTTSLRGIRKTFEDCNHVRFILQSLGLSLDERDVSMHAEFRQELKELVASDTPPVQVPRVFIKGRYIGGAADVSKLHEDGTLAVLVEGLPSQISREGCDGCGGVRFVPCLDCSGSCKVITDANEVTRCTECNENGLMRCPICD